MFLPCSILGVTPPVYHLGPSSLQKASKQALQLEVLGKRPFFADSQNCSSPEQCNKLRWSCSATYQTGHTTSAAKHFPEGDTKLLTSQLIPQEQPEVWIAVCKLPLKKVLDGQARSQDGVRNAPRKPATIEEPTVPTAQPQWLDQFTSLSEY